MKTFYLFIFLSLFPAVVLARPGWTPKDSRWRDSTINHRSFETLEELNKVCLSYKASHYNGIAKWFKDENGVYNVDNPGTVMCYCLVPRGQSVDCLNMFDNRRYPE